MTDERTGLINNSKTYENQLSRLEGIKAVSGVADRERAKAGGISGGALLRRLNGER